MSQGQDAPLLAHVPQKACQSAISKKAPKAPKDIQPTKQGLKITTLLKIAMPKGQDAPLSADVPREQGQGATLKNAPKVPKEAKQGLKMATRALQDAPLSLDVPKEPCQDASSKKAPAPKAPMEAQPTKQDMIVLEGESPLKVQKSGQANKLHDTAGFKPPKTERLKRMKEVEVREAIERKLAVDEVKVKGHTGKGQLEKVSEVKIALKKDGVKNNAKKHVEKGQEDEGPHNKARALVSFSKRPKLQDGSGDDDPNYGSNGDVDNDDGESDKSDGGDDISGGSDSEDDGSGGGGSGSGGNGSGSGGDDISGGDDDEDDGIDDGGGSGKGDSESETHIHVQLPPMSKMPDLPGTSQQEEEEQGPAPGALGVRVELTHSIEDMLEGLAKEFMLYEVKVMDLAILPFLQHDEQVKDMGHEFLPLPLMRHEANMWK
ncbi:hypothetical protein L7F22_062976 [Adiantum nelumboides]|nr:hypothetical protein [Adiantum nelumboides]